MDVSHTPNMTEFTCEEEEEKYYIQYELYTLWDTNNGITLCIDCYDIYDALLCCIKATTIISGSSDKEDSTTNTTAATTTALTTPVTTTNTANSTTNTSTTKYTILVSNVLKSYPMYTEKWSRLDGACVSLPEPMFMNRWPSVVLLQYRENMYNKYTLENHPLEVTLPYECTHCGMRTKTEVRLASHMRSKACLGTATAAIATAAVSTDCKLPATTSASTSSHPTLPAATVSATLQTVVNLPPAKQRRSRGRKKRALAVETAIKPS